MLNERSEKKIRVLHVVGGMSAGGLETLIMNIYRNIDRSKVQFDFAVQNEKKCFYDDEIIKMGGRIILHPSPQKSLIEYKKALKNTLEKYGEYDAVHSHILFFSGIVLEVAKKQKVPIRIAHSHNTSDSKKTSFIRKIYRELMRRKIIKNATHLVGCSREACEYVFGKSQYENENARHFPNAIEINKYRYLENINNVLKEELKIPEDSIIIGHIGRFSKQKNHSFIIEVFSKYCKKAKNAHLVLVGEGAEIESVKRKVIEKNLVDRVHFLGLRKDVPEILSSIDLFLFPSLYEGLGIVVVEAQAAGLPCLVANTIPIEADIKIGLINRLDLKEDNSEIWAEKMLGLTNKNKPNWKIIEPALKKSGYDIEESSKKLLRIYVGTS